MTNTNFRLHQQKLALERLFSGDKQKWFTLYKRLAARLSSIPEIELLPSLRGVSIRQTEQNRQVVGVIHVLTNKGLEIGLAIPKVSIKSIRLKPSQRKLKRITYELLITSTRDIDDELLSWLRATIHQTRPR